MPVPANVRRATVFAPHGSRHTFKNIGTTPGRTVTTVVPGDVDIIFEELKEKAKKLAELRRNIQQLEQIRDRLQAEIDDELREDPLAEEIYTKLAAIPVI